MGSSEAYHHGNLRATLVDAAFEAAKNGGLQALVIRDLARAAGVSPAAAYHHFADREHLVAAVSQRAREAIATHMIRARAEVSPRLAPTTRAVRRLAAIGQAYLDFAYDQPHLVRVAFVPIAAKEERPDDPVAWDVLVEALNELHETGGMDSGRRDGAEAVVWSLVHGVSVLRNDGAIPSDVARDIVDRRIMEGVLDALGCPGRARVRRPRRRQTPGGMPS